MIDKETESKLVEHESKLEILEATVTKLADSILQLDKILNSIAEQLQQHDNTNEQND